MAVIWGLDLKEMQWWKFKGHYMFNQVYHLRRTKMIVYQLAMILCVVSESVGTASLSDYVDEQDGIQTRDGRAAHVQNNDIVGILSFNIFVGIAVATIFGSGFFFDLFWPERHESPSVKMAWRICSVLMCIFTLADAIALTVIVATHQNGKPNPIYRKNPYNVASVVILWPGFVATCASTYIVWKSLQHNDKLGPFSSKYKNNTTGDKGEEASMEMPSTTSKPVDPATNGHSVPPTPSEPAAAHTTQPYPGT
ncbi:hypothetical protein BDZ45DRAFT_700355 [Acephala macrosclerotiorum]|nr:hypothetical protein BDZ45DRAFT_700355 [Acephala macrosclerotiorum]